VDRTPELKISIEEKKGVNIEKYVENKLHIKISLILELKISIEEKGVNNIEKYVENKLNNNLI
jgi:hypothetical protein